MGRLRNGPPLEVHNPVNITDRRARCSSHHPSRLHDSLEAQVLRSSSAGFGYFHVPSPCGADSVVPQPGEHPRNAPHARRTTSTTKKRAIIRHSEMKRVKLSEQYHFVLANPNLPNPNATKPKRGAIPARIPATVSASHRVNTSPDSISPSNLARKSRRRTSSPVRGPPCWVFVPPVKKPRPCVLLTATRE